MRHIVTLSVIATTSLILASCGQSPATTPPAAPGGSVLNKSTPQTAPLTKGEVPPVPKALPIPEGASSTSTPATNSILRQSNEQRSRFAKAYQNLTLEDRVAIDEVLRAAEAKSPLSASEKADLIVSEVLKRGDAQNLSAQGAGWEYPNRLNQLEESLVWWEPPHVVWGIDQIRRDALARSQMYTATERNRGVGDAWRHMYWNARMTQDFGLERARIWSWAHDCVDSAGYAHDDCEREVTGYYYWNRPQEQSNRYYTERDMDINNNYVGQWVGYYNGTLGQDRLSSAIQTYVSRGYYGNSDIWKIEAQNAPVGTPVYRLGNENYQPCVYVMWDPNITPEKAYVREYWCTVRSDYIRPYYVQPYN